MGWTPHEWWLEVTNLPRAPAPNRERPAGKSPRKSGCFSLLAAWQRQLLGPINKTHLELDTWTTPTPDFGPLWSVVQLGPLVNPALVTRHNTPARLQAASRGAVSSLEPALLPLVDLLKELHEERERLLLVLRWHLEADAAHLCRCMYVRVRVAGSREQVSR